MWVKVDDGFTEHPKVMRAAEHLGGGAGAYRRVVAVWVEAICYANRNMTDGFISERVAKRMHSDRKAIDVLNVFSFDDVRLMRAVDGGFKFYKYEQYQPLAATVKKRREKDLARKRGLSGKDSAQNPSLPVPVPVSTTEEQRGQAAPRLVYRRPDTDPPNVGALTALAHDVIQNSAPDTEVGDLMHTLKGRAAQLRMAYDGQSVRKAVESTMVQRRHKAGQR